MIQLVASLKGNNNLGKFLKVGKRPVVLFDDFLKTILFITMLVIALAVMNIQLIN